MSVQGGPGDRSGNGSGQFGSYVPPPPPSTKRSPWLFVALGCGALLVLAFGGCVTLVMVAKNKITTAMNQPLDKAALERDLADVPAYPKAKLDEKGTKAAGAVMGMMKFALKAGQSMTFAAYQTPDDDAKIFAWYDKAMVDAGYKRVQTKKKTPSASEQHLYQKGDVIVMVQIPNNSSTASFILTRMQGMKEGEMQGVSVDTSDSSPASVDTGSGK